MEPKVAWCLGELKETEVGELICGRGTMAAEH